MRLYSLDSLRLDPAWTDARPEADVAELRQRVAQRTRGGCPARTRRHQRPGPGSKWGVLPEQSPSDTGRSPPQTRVQLGLASAIAQAAARTGGVPVTTTVDIRWPLVRHAAEFPVHHQHELLSWSLAGRARSPREHFSSASIRSEGSVVRASDSSNSTRRVHVDAPVHRPSCIPKAAPSWGQEARHRGVSSPARGAPGRSPCPRPRAVRAYLVTIKGYMEVAPVRGGRSEKARHPRGEGFSSIWRSVVDASFASGARPSSDSASGSKASVRRRVNPGAAERTGGPAPPWLWAVPP